jgi:hypothetical protein
VSTYGILFLGTPHNGSSKAGLASVGSRMISALTPSKVLDTDSQLADALYEGSEVLQNITDMFAPLMKNFRIYFFWEQEKTNLGTTLAYVCTPSFTVCFHPSQLTIWRQIVDENSAAPILDNTERAGLPYGHRAMAKFETRSSPGYRLVVAALLRYSREAPDFVSVRWLQAEKMLQSKRQNEAAELMQ